MSVGRIGKTTNSADDTIGQAITDERKAMWGEIPGEIVSFDAVAQTATIKPLYRPKFNGKPIDMPELLEVPVRMVRAGGGGVTFPVGAGDKVTLRPQMRSTENYLSDDDGTASDDRSFNISDMEAHLDGGESLTDPIKNFDNANVHVRFDDEGQFGVRGSKDGKVAIEGAEGNIYLLLARAVEIIAEHETQVTAGSSTGTYSHTLAGEAAAIAAKLRAMAL